LVSTRRASQPNTRSSSDPGASRTKSTSDASLGSRPRRSLGWRSRRRRRTHKSVVRLLAHITSTYRSGKFANWESKTEFRLLLYERTNVLPEAARRIPATAWAGMDIPANSRRARRVREDDHRMASGIGFAAPSTGETPARVEKVSI